jgi:hypothetical protein
VRLLTYNYLRVLAARHFMTQAAETVEVPPVQPRQGVELEIV